tara:strand:+ start:864 stop:1319 length:456 start_codon:yes stop_codon:yes gene_type:complete
MKNIVIFDLDGTLALIDKRREISTKSDGKLDWDLFFNPKNINLDIPNFPVINTLKALKSNGYKIIILSGRLETTKNATLEWLKKYEVYFDDLKMRENSVKGKFISDVELKEKWLSDIGKENVEFVFDDRKKLVDMWRNQGLICFQVAEGNF